MKKIFNKLSKKNDQDSPSRITLDTLETHREDILAKGRKFKYPIQYARHKLVYNTIIISVLAIVVVVVIGWWQLYLEQNTSEFMYRVTKVLPVPVASVDGRFVAYSDYLMKYRSSVYSLERKNQLDPKTEDGKRQILYQKQQALDYSISETYAAKLASDLKMSVSDVEVEAFFKAQKQSYNWKVSDKTYESVIADVYNWSLSDYRYVIKNDLLSLKIAYKIDKKALDVVEKAKAQIANNKDIDLKTLASDLSTQSGIKVDYGASGLVSKSNQDGGLSIEATKLTKNQLSSVVKPTTGDGYYFIRLTDINDSQVNYEFVHIPLTQFKSQLKEVADTGKIQKYISL